VTSGKILFIHRLYSGAAAYYLKLILELFDLDEKEVWERLIAKRKETFSAEARQRLRQTRAFAPIKDPL
ncbi:MAG: hypothetical protein PHC61_19085, partial [Chitinivibrionales bacterium]|nr:hypothetical protein [Chitinivibrionales bacterium]